MSTEQSLKLSGSGKIALFVLLIVIGLIYSTEGEPAKEQPQEASDIALEQIEALVTFVIDGDTLTLENGEKVRLIGIDTPENGEAGYEEARDALADLILNKEVTLVQQQSNRDTYDRLLRDVYVGETFVNLNLVQNGFATALPIEPDTRFASLLWEAEKAFELKK